jgi:DNA repair protein RecN (Recombination protein N)
LTREIEQKRSNYMKGASALSNARRHVAADFARQLEHVLGELAMEGTRFEVRFADPLPEGEWTPAGIDSIEFFVSPNPGEELRPLARIVSGGELSRIMLAIKTLTATSRHGFNDSDQRPPSAAAPGLIFDEVDAGIGGRTADVVGRKLRTLGSAFQVLCITHLPQIAAYADTHFVIEKRVDEGRTRTEITRLEDEARVEELVRMLGGGDRTDSLLATAREMLAGRQNRSGRGVAGRAAARMSEAKAKSESERAKGEGRAVKPRSTGT